MKFIIVAIIVSAFALSFSSGLRIIDFTVPFFKRLAFKDTFNNYTIVRNARIDFSSRYANKLGIQYFDTQSAILEIWRRCDEELLIYPRFDRSLDVFANPPIDETRNMTTKDKCLYYCMLNGTSVLTDEGFQEEIYMDYIRKLRFNSTSFDIGEDEPMARRELSDTIDDLTSHLDRYSMYQFPRSMNDIIELYAEAANECKRFRLPKESLNYEIATFVLECMMARNKMNGLNSPFYPLWLKD